jgi:hypothetical protein
MTDVQLVKYLADNLGDPGIVGMGVMSTIGGMLYIGEIERVDESYVHTNNGRILVGGKRFKKLILTEPRT